jgi:thymidylate synthase (FAD)
MHTQEIKVFPIAQTSCSYTAILEWLRYLGVKAPEQVISPYLQAGVSDPAMLVALAGKRCYMSFEADGSNPNVTKIRENPEEYVTNILKSGHGSVLEHVTFTYAIEGITRVGTGELNRHRAGVAISEGSMRYIRFDDVGFWMPDSLTCDEAEVGDNTPEHVSDLDDQNRGRQKLLTQEKLKEAFAGAERIYLDLCQIWKIGEMKDFGMKKKLTSMFRRVIGMGVSTGGVWTFNARALRHILALRTTEHAEEEISHVFNLIAEHAIKAHPLLFSDFVRNDNGEWIPKYPKI